MTVDLTPYQTAVLQHFADLSSMALEDYVQQRLGAVLIRDLEPTYLDAQKEAFVSALKDDTTHAEAASLSRAVRVADGVVTRE